MGVYSKKSAKVSDKLPDEVYVIYGPPGQGKSSLLDTFPKTKELPQLLVDLKEGGESVIEPENREATIVVEIDTPEELIQLLEDAIDGKDRDTGETMKFSSIGFDSLTGLEDLVKEMLKTNSGKERMNKNLWGLALDEETVIITMMKTLFQKLQIPIAAVVHAKEITDEKHPDFGMIRPALMKSGATKLCAKASYVWYIRVEYEALEVDGKMKRVPVFMTTIGPHEYLLTKCRKPKSMQIPQKVKNLTYDKFKKNVIDKMSTYKNEGKKA